MGASPTEATKMSEQRILASLGPQWKDRYIVDWCHLCDCAMVICPDCKNGSCNGSGCDKCGDDFDTFRSFANTVEHYLCPLETTCYKKGLRLQRLIVDSIARNESRLDFKTLKKDGHLSKNDEAMFGIGD